MSSDIQNLAKKLIMINHRESSSSRSSAIFGSVADIDPAALIQRASYRIAMWPLISTVNQENAHTVWVILSYLLEARNTVQIYRLPLQVGEYDPESYEINDKDSQFSVDDWQLEDLDENIALWGTINQIEDELNLTISLENDLLENESVETFTTASATWEGLVASLPELANDILEHIGVDRGSENIPLYNTDSISMDAITPLIFDWERKVFLYLWGWDWSDNQILKDARHLIEATKQADQSFSYWVTASAFARSFSPGLIVIGDLLAEIIPNALDDWHYEPRATVVLADGLWRAGYTEQATHLLTASAERHPQDTLLGRKQGLRAAEVGDIVGGINILQSSINKLDDQAVNEFRLFTDYGTLLQLAMQADIEVDSLLWANETHPNALANEAIRAYENAFRQNSNSLGVLYNLAMLTMHIDETRFWEVFESLLIGDKNRKYINDVIDAMEEIAYITPAVEMAQNSASESPTVDSLISLARVYMLAEENNQALEVLNNAYQQTEDLDIRTEIESLKLICKNPEFEYLFGEANAVIDAGNEPSDSTLEFLEEVVEEAPLFLEGYLVLARAYISIDDYESAIEVLLDADKAIHNQPDVMDLLAKCLWETDEKDLAFQYVNRGLREAPTHISLLLRAGQMLFDNGQFEDARQFIARAEVISPNSGALAALRAYIARNIDARGTEY